MAAISVKQYRDFGFFFDDLPGRVQDLVRVSGDSKTVTVTVDGAPNVQFVLKGSGLKFDKQGAFVSGTITYALAQVKVGSKFVKAVEFNGFSLDVKKALSDPDYAPFAGQAMNYNASSFVPDQGSLLGVKVGGTGLADTIVGSAYSDELYGYAGNDVIKGGGGDDFLIGGGGKDKLYGEAGHDILVGDKLADYFDGGDGIDMVDYGNATKGVLANLANPAANTGFAAGDRYVSIESLSGSQYNDKLYGNAADNMLAGFGGNDVLDGGAGNDVLFGGAGSDKLIGGAGSDTAAYSVRLPNGLIGLSSNGKGVTADLANSAKNAGDAKGDTYSSIENLLGSTYADKLYGDAKANVLTGDNGNDLLDGRAGNDTLIGGAGADRLYGGAGADKFVFLSTSDSTVNSRDTIYKFSQAEKDKIDVSAIDANSTAINNQAFAFIGAKDFTGKAGQLRYEKADGGTYVYADVNGDKKADLAIFLDTAVNLTKADFLL